MTLITMGNSGYNKFFNKFYTSNRLAGKNANRSSQGKASLVSADSDALKKIAENLGESSFDSENGTEIFNNIKAFVDTYNNLVDSSSGVVSRELERDMKKLKSFMKDNSEDLEKMGISISSNGKIKLNKDDLAECSPSKISSFFSKTSDKSSTIIKYMKKINRISKPLIQEEQAKKVRDEQNSLNNSSTPSNNIISSTSIDFRA